MWNVEENPSGDRCAVDILYAGSGVCSIADSLHAMASFLGMLKPQAIAGKPLSRRVQRARAARLLRIFGPALLAIEVALIAAAYWIDL
ncbi:hypothetical protein ACK6D9_23145 (plasmid) [Hoeflea sp. Naph1]|uniref:hypothetical protein n=1 Tax=Hoeflea sp. Naph1 TaxID=3388653 RepID=UPI0039900453